MAGVSNIAKPVHLMMVPGQRLKAWMSLHSLLQLRDGDLTAFGSVEEC